jgi:hypothetical protein
MAANNQQEVKEGPGYDNGCYLGQVGGCGYPNSLFLAGLPISKIVLKLQSHFSRLRFFPLLPTSNDYCSAVF